MSGRNSLWLRLSESWAFGRRGAAAAIAPPPYTAVNPQPAALAHVRCHYTSHRETSTIDDAAWYSGGLLRASVTMRADISKQTQVLHDHVHGASEARPPRQQARQEVAKALQDKARLGRHTRMLLNPFQGVFSVSSCIEVMKASNDTAGLMQRVVGIHTLQKALCVARKPPAACDSSEHALMAWLSPLVDRVSQLRARASAQLLYALAKMHQVQHGWEVIVAAPHVHGMLEQLLEQLADMVPDMESQEISNCAYACALLGPESLRLTEADSPAARLVASLTVVVEQSPGAFQARHLANMAWSFARLAVEAPEAYRTIVRQLITTHRGVANAQDVANSVWALARSHSATPELLQLVEAHMLRPIPSVGDARAARGHISSFSVAHLLMTLWAFGQCGAPAQRLYDAAALRLQDTVWDAPDRALVSIAQTFTQSCVRRTPQRNELLRRTASALAQRVPGSPELKQRTAAKPHALANVLYHLSVLAASVPAPSANALGQASDAGGGRSAVQAKLVDSPDADAVLCFDVSDADVVRAAAQVIHAIELANEQDVMILCSTLDTSSCVRMMIALQRLDCRAEKLSRALSQSVAPQILDMQPAQIVATAIWCARINGGSQDWQLGGALATAAELLAEEFSEREAHTLLKSLQQSGLVAPDAFRKLQARARHMEQATGRGRSSSVEALGAEPAAEHRCTDPTHLATELDRTRAWSAKQQAAPTASVCHFRALARKQKGKLKGSHKKRWQIDDVLKDIE